MGCGPVLRAGDASDRSLVAALGQLEFAETDGGEWGFRYSGTGWLPGFMGCGRKNGHVFSPRHRLRFRPVADVQRLAALT